MCPSLCQSFASHLQVVCEPSQNRRELIRWLHNCKVRIRMGSYILHDAGQRVLCRTIHILPKISFHTFAIKLLENIIHHLTNNKTIQCELLKLKKRMMNGYLFEILPLTRKLRGYTMRASNIRCAPAKSFGHLIRNDTEQEPKLRHLVNI